MADEQYNAETKTWWHKDHGKISPQNTSAGQTVTDAMRSNDNQDRMSDALDSMQKHLTNAQKHLDKAHGTLSGDDDTGPIKPQSAKSGWYDKSGGDE